MALTSVGYGASVVMRDSSNRKFTKSLTFDSSIITFASAQSVAASFITALDAVTDCVVENYRVSEIFEESAFALPTGGVNGYEQAAIVANIEGELKTVTLYIPAPVDGMFVSTTGPNRDIVDVTDTALLAFLELYTTTDGELEISDGEKLDDTNPLRQGQRINRKSTSV